MSAPHQPDSMPGYSLPVYPYRRPPELSGGSAQEYPVIVAGGGLGGLACALELGSRGIRTVVLDDDNTVGASGLSSRGICYAKRTLEILDRFGVAERIRAKGITWNEGDVYRGERRLYRFNLQPEADQKFPAFVNLQQFYVEQYLVEAIAAYPCIDLRWKNKVVDVRPGAGHVEVSVETPEGTYSTRCTYLVGADGAHSIVREKVGAKDAEAALFDTAWCIADVRMAPSTEAVRKAYLDNPLNEGGAIWYHQMADGVWRTDWQIGHYADPDAEATPERANLRLRQLLGPGVEFELVWVGMWRFRKRYLEKMRHGRVFFLGDASAQHSPFGARGGNRAVQDANNLGWKLALVLEGQASPALLDTYHAERHQAARECVEISSRSAIFIAPESPGQRLVRDAILDLAERHPAARSLVNVGRLSEACVYAQTPLRTERDDFDAPAALPGAAAPDGKVRDGGFVERLQGHFTVAWFGARGPDINARVATTAFTLERESAPALFERYGVRDTATYVFRPDGHVLARCRGIDAAFAESAIESALRGGDTALRPKNLPQQTQLEMDRRYDAYAAQIDATAQADRGRALAGLVADLAQQVGVAPPA
ncbi:MAG: FAD-dependent monooxygenase [Proteobacteria bacterium]|nr:FAD-dependent monooxygenase [Pseudomonadota bacterium]